MFSHTSWILTHLFYLKNSSKILIKLIEYNQTFICQTTYNKFDPIQARFAGKSAIKEYKKKMK